MFRLQCWAAVWQMARSYPPTHPPTTSPLSQCTTNAQIAMLGGNVAEGEEEGVGAPGAPGAARPAHPVPKGKASKPMGVDEVRRLGCLVPLRLPRGTAEPDAWCLPAWRRLAPPASGPQRHARSRPCTSSLTAVLGEGRGRRAAAAQAVSWCCWQVAEHGWKWQWRALLHFTLDAQPLGLPRLSFLPINHCLSQYRKFKDNY